jgi:hypothetical protein
LTVTVIESYYPSLAIANGLYPEHLGEAFVKVYADMKNDRTSFKKGTPENAMLKLAYPRISYSETVCVNL